MNSLFIEIKNYKQQFYLVNSRMNPQNIGAHIELHHSSLWRKSMWTPKDLSSKDSCHNQLNEMGQTGRSWRSRDNFIRTNFSFLGKSSLPKSNRSSLLNKTLNLSKRQSPETKSFIEEIEKHSQAVDKNRKLVEGMSKLKQMNLLNVKQLNQVKFPGILRREHVYNDYHERVANPGFSRNYQGKFFTK